MSYPQLQRRWFGSYCYYSCTLDVPPASTFVLCLLAKAQSPAALAQNHQECFSLGSSVRKDVVVKCRWTHWYVGSLEGLQENKAENMLSPLMSGSEMDIGPSLKAKWTFLTSCR